MYGDLSSDKSYFIHFLISLGEKRLRGIVSGDGKNKNELISSNFGDANPF